MPRSHPPGNPFLHPVDELHFDTYRPHDVAEALEITRALAEERYAAVRSLPHEERTFANTVLAFTRATEEFSSVVGRIHHLAAVLPGWGEAEERASSSSAELGNEVAFDVGLYEALRTFRERTPAQELADNERLLLKELVEGYERNGVALPEPVQEELRTVRARLSELSTQFKVNAVEASNAAGLQAADVSELAGLSEAFVARCREAAAGRGSAGYWISYDPPTYVEVMTSCASAATRQRMYDLQVSLAGEANAAVAAEILTLRRRMAQLLGFADYADLATVERMAGTGERAALFLRDLEQRYRPLALAEHEELLAYARDLEGDPALELTAADVDTGYNFYYANKLYGERVGLDPRTLHDYLPLPQVVAETFRVLGSLYGVSFTEADRPTWHQDVTVYDMHGEDGRHLATVFTDWPARPDKRSGAWAQPAYKPPRGNADNAKPFLGYLVFNFPSAEPGQPVLLSPRDAETVLHEFGHFIHNALSATPLPEQAGTACRRDFVEAPSQIMENWFWQPEVLDRMARHHRTGEPLPAEAVRALLEARNFRAGAVAMRQLGLATVDLEMHRSYEGGDLYEFARSVKAPFLPVPVWGNDCTPGNFSHVFAAPYAAGYYSYKWAEVIEAAFFERFAREGILSRDVGRAYARDVLSRGAEVEPDELVHAFLGGPASPDALLRRDGLAVPDQR